MSGKTKASWFARNPKLTIGATIGAGLVISVIVAELALRSLMGLGNPVLYYSYPLYGYRLLPNQEVTRFHGAVIKVNNLGLRANDDWDERIDNKILFLGDSVTYGGSYISNDELFSSLAVRNIHGYQSGNAGANGWGVDNIYGLIVNSEFTPARIYVTVIPEVDFNRGVTRLEGLWVWCFKPTFAIQELVHLFYYKQNLKRFIQWKEHADEQDVRRVVENGVIKLKEMDNWLKARGYRHLIYISPSRKQVTRGAAKREAVQELLEKHNVEVRYLLDTIKSLNLSDGIKRSLFHDKIHLEKGGHKLWGEIIGRDLMRLVAKRM